MAAVEVTSAVDEVKRAQMAAIFRHRELPPYIEIPSCDGTWMLWLGRTARVNRLRAGLEGSLASLEAAGIERFYGEEAEGHPASKALYELGIESASRMPTTKSGRAFVQPAEFGGIVSTDHALAAVRVEAAKADNLAKLQRAEAPQSHLFVFIDMSMSDAWAALVAGDLPEIPADLPDAVTHLWVAAAAGDSQAAVWSYVAGDGWSHHGLVPVPPC